MKNSVLFVNFNIFSNKLKESIVVVVVLVL